MSSLSIRKITKGIVVALCYLSFLIYVNLHRSHIAPFAERTLNLFLESRAGLADFLVILSLIRRGFLENAIGLSNFFVAVVIICEGSLIGLILVRLLRIRSINSIIACATIGTAAILLSFHLLGFVSMIAAVNIVTTRNAATLLGIVLAIIYTAVWLRKKSLFMSHDFKRGRLRTLRLSQIDWVIVFSLIVLFILYLAVCVKGLSGPPEGWDVRHYHLPMAINWLQHQNLTEAVADVAIAWFQRGIITLRMAFVFPGNGNILMMLLLSSGSDLFVPIIQLPFAILSSLIVCVSNEQENRR